MHPKSYEHIADANGYLFDLGGGYYIYPWWSIDLLGRWQYWKAENVTDRTFFSDGTTGETKLNESIWTSLSVSLANTMHF
jgi:hypothetical protein